MRDELNIIKEKLGIIEKLSTEVNSNLETMNRIKSSVDSLETEIQIREKENIKLDSELESYRKSLNESKKSVQETSLKLQLLLAKGHIDIQRLMISKENIKVKPWIHFII